MRIDLKSNRSFIIKMYSPFLIITAILTVLLLATLISGSQKWSDLYKELIIMCALLIVELGIMFFAKFYNGRSYSFTEQKISVCNKGKHVFEINLEDVESIKYYVFKFRYIITIFAGALNEGGVWKLHIKLNSGTKKELAFFAKKDVIKLKELYKDLLIIS